MAQTYLRIGGRERDVLTLYRHNLQYETSALRQSICAMIIYWLDFAVSPTPRERKALPPHEAEFMALYEKSTDAQRAEMSPNDLARATWVYYALGRMDLVESNTVAALVKFDAASASPDNFLAAEALYQSALIYAEKGDLRQTRDCLEHLLFSTKAVEPTVKATYELARCLKAAGEFDLAFGRLNELVTRYPSSPYAALAREDPLYLEKKKAEPPSSSSTAGQRVPAAAVPVSVTATQSVPRAASATVSSTAPSVSPSPSSASQPKAPSTASARVSTPSSKPPSTAAAGTNSSAKPPQRATAPAGAVDKSMVPVSRGAVTSSGGARNP
jgi:tetratricopeptide (TPR) repeat protein